MWKISPVGWIGRFFAIIFGLNIINTAFIRPEPDISFLLFAIAMYIFGMYGWLSKIWHDRALARLKAGGEAYKAEIEDFEQWKFLFFEPRLKPHRYLRFVCRYCDGKGVEHSVKSRWYAVRRKWPYKGDWKAIDLDEFCAVVYVDPRFADDYAIDVRVGRTGGQAGGIL